MNAPAASILTLVLAVCGAPAATRGDSGLRGGPGAVRQPIERSALICRISTTARVAFLTFDDGPGPATVAILDLLRDQGIRAVFFVLGDVAQYRTGVLQRIVAEGHEIGNHTWSHRRWFAAEKTTDPPRLLEALERELADTERLIEETVGIPPRFLRMPEGFYRPWMNPLLRQRDYRIVNWTAGYDWHRMTEDEMAERYCSALVPGGIYLFHDGGVHREKTVAVVRRFIAYARERGYTFGELGAWLESAEAVR